MKRQCIKFLKITSEYLPIMLKDERPMDNATLLGLTPSKVTKNNKSKGKPPYSNNNSPNLQHTQKQQLLHQHPLLLQTPMNRKSSGSKCDSEMNNKSKSKGERNNSNKNKLSFEEKMHQVTSSPRSNSHHCRGSSSRPKIERVMASDAFYAGGSMANAPEPSDLPLPPDSWCQLASC